MKNRDLLKLFYEEKLKPKWNVEFETFNESELRLLEESICFSKWKLDQKVKSFKTALNNLGIAARNAAKTISDFNNQLNF